MQKFFQNIFLAGILISTPILYPSYVTDHKSLGNWLSSNFSYQGEPEGQDYWKKPKETIRDKGGDCDDSAILVKHILDELNYDNYMVCLTFSDRKTSHALNILKIDGKFTTYSNFVYFPKSFSTLRGLLAYYYPKWHKIYYIMADRPNRGMLIGVR